MRVSWLDFIFSSVGLGPGLSPLSWGTTWRYIRSFRVPIWGKLGLGVKVSGWVFVSLDVGFKWETSGYVFVGVPRVLVLPNCY